MSGETRIDVLGVCRVLTADGTVIEFSAIQRKILTCLAVSAPRPVSKVRLIESIWGDDPPSTANAALQNQISRIRAKIAPDVVVTEADGYRVTARIDRDEANDLIAAAEVALLDGDAAEAFTLTEAALALWRGEPLSDLDGAVDLNSELHFLDEMYSAAEKLRASAALALGRYAWTVIESERLVAARPLDEARWATLIEALDQSGRRGDALGAYDRARKTLVSQLGLEPGPRLRAAEAMVLAVQPDLTPRVVGRSVRSSISPESILAAAADSPVVLVGESGLGKTSALAAIARSCRGQSTRVIAVRCVRHVDAPAAVLAEIVDELGVTWNVGADPVHSFVRAVRTVGDRKVIIVVDDLDHAGPTTTLALFAASELDHVSLIASAENLGSVHREGRPFEIVALAPLDDAELAELTSQAFGRTVPSDDPVVGWVAEMTGGNPMLVECLLSDLAVHGLDSSAIAERAMRIEPGVRSIVKRRLEGVDAEVRALLSTAAVCGTEFTIELLETFADASVVTAALGAGLLVASDRSDGRSMRFRHGAVRSVLYSDLTPGARQEIHHAVATRLAANGANAQHLAAHALAAVDLAPLAAAHAAFEAGVESSSAGAHAEAAEWFAAAADVASSFDVESETFEIEALIRYGDSLRQSGDERQEVALFHAADRAVALGDCRLIGEATFAVLELGATSEAGGAHERALALVEQALPMLEHSEAAARVCAAASLMLSMNGHPQRCLDFFCEAESRAVSSAARRDVLPFAYLGLGHPRFLQRRVELTAELLALGQSADDPIALFEGHQLAHSNAIQLADGEAVRFHTAAMEPLVERTGDVGRRWSLLHQQSAIAHLDGDLDTSERLAGEALAVFGGVSPSRALASFSGQLLILRVASGRVDELADAAQQLVNDQPGVPAWRAALALCLAKHEPERAAELVQSSLIDTPDDFTWLAAHVIGARAAAIVGRQRTVREFIARLDPYSGLVCWQGTCSYGPVDLVLAMLSSRLGMDHAAQRYTRRAIAQSEQLGAPVFAEELVRWNSRHTEIADKTQG